MEKLFVSTRLGMQFLHMHSTYASPFLVSLFFSRLHRLSRLSLISLTQHLDRPLRLRLNRSRSAALRYHIHQFPISQTRSYPPAPR